MCEVIYDDSNKTEHIVDLLSKEADEELYSIDINKLN